MANDITIPLKIETADAVRAIQTVKREMERAATDLQHRAKEMLHTTAGAGGGSGGGGGGGGAGSARLLAAAGMGGRAGAAGGAAGAVAAGLEFIRNSPITAGFNSSEGLTSGSMSVGISENMLNRDLIPGSGIKIRSALGAVSPEMLHQFKAEASAIEQVKAFAGQMQMAGGQMSQPEMQEMFHALKAQEERRLLGETRAVRGLEGETMIGQSMNFVMEKMAQLFEKGAAYQEHEH